MELHEHYIINPNYILMNDGNRVSLTNPRSNHLTDRFPYVRIETFIHPLQARMLSFFNGEDDLSTVIRKLGDYLEIPESEISAILQRYIGQEENFTIRFDDQAVQFPAHLLVPRESQTDYPTYSAGDFPITGQVDLRTKRFNFPRNFLLILSTACYTDCVYCYADRKHPFQHKLSEERIFQLVDEIESVGGALSIDCSGGDILMRPESYRIIRHLVERDYQPIVSTKFPLSASMVRQLKETGLRELQISLDASDPDVLSALLGVKGRDYLERMSQTFAELDRAGMQVRVHPVLTSLNSSKRQAEELIEFLLRFGCVRKIHFTPAGCSLFKEPESFPKIKTSPADLDDVHELVQHYSAKYPDRAFSIEVPSYLRQDFESPEAKARMFAERTRCGGNMSSLVILPDGQATICEELYWHPQFILGDLTCQSIAEVWNSEKALNLYRLSREDISEESACKQCPQFDACRKPDTPFCWKQVQYFYGREHWDFPHPSCAQAPAAYHDCMV